MNLELIKLLDKNLLIAHKISEQKSKEAKLLKINFPAKYDHNPVYIKYIPYPLYIITAYIIFLILKNLDLPQMIISILEYNFSNSMIDFFKEVFLSAFFRGALALVYLLIVLFNFSIARRWSIRLYDKILKKKLCSRKLFIEEETKRLKHKYSTEIEGISNDLDLLYDSADLHREFLNAHTISNLKKISQIYDVNSLESCIELYTKKEFELKLFQKLDTIIQLQKELLDHVNE